MKKTKYVLVALCVSMLSFGASAGVIPATYNGIADSGDELWTYTDNSNVLDDSGFEMLFEYGQFNTNDHAFGMYQYDNVANSVTNMLKIFDYGDSNDSNVVWDFTGNSVATRYGSTDIDFTSFGFWFTSDYDTFYSQAQFNSNSEDLFGFYWESDPFVDSNLYIYASDNDSGINYDYMNIAANDVQPLGAGTTQIPEPTGLALFGLAFLGMRALHKINLKHNC